jgi:hypothetical protein
MAHLSASLNRRSEDIRVLAIVIAELKFGNIERHIFPAHFVKCADDAAFENRPEAFNGLSVDCANDVLAARVVNDCVREIFVERIVARICIGAKQTDFMRDRFPDEGGESGGSHVRNYTRDNISLTADGADDWSFAGTDATSSATAAAFISMPIFGQAANESFIDFDNSAELPIVFHQCNSDAVTHIPSRFQRAKSHITPNLPSAYSLFAGEHQVNDAIPVAKRLIRVFEDCSGNMRKAIAVWCALFTLPMPLTGRKIVHGGVAATGATDALRPAPRDQIRLASLFVRKHFLELCDCQLMDLSRLFCAGHGSSSECERTLS